MQAPGSHRLWLLAVGVGFEGGLALLAWLLGWLLDHQPFSHVHWTAKALLYGIIATLPLLVIFVLLERSSHPVVVPLRQFVHEFIGPLFEGFTLAELALISALAGLGEETLFRGVLQEVLAGWIGVVPALLTASLLFGLVHAFTVLYTILATCFGLYLGCLWLWTDNLVVPILAHGLYDFLILWYLVRPSSPRLEAEATAEMQPDPEA